MRAQFAILGVGGLLAALLVGGCGGGDAAVTKQAFIKEADAICVEQKQAIKSQPRVNQTDIKRTLEETTAALRSEYDEIEAIGIPAGDEKEVRRMLRNVEEALKFAELKQANIAKANEFLFKAEEQADDYGVKQCWLA